MAKSLRDRLPYFYKQIFKTRKRGQHQHCSYIKITSLKLAKSDPFFFHENHRIPVCKKTNKMFLIESITRQNIDLAFIQFSLIFTFSRVNSLQD